MSHEDISQYLMKTRTEWIFNVERAPWWGGVFERMVKSVKRCLRKIIGQAKLTYDELHTAIVEIEMVINSRPLSYISQEDLEEPLTPSHLMIGRRILSLPSNLHNSQEDNDTEATPELLTRRMRYLNSTLDQFWKRWRSEYLLELREHHRFNMSNTGSQVSVGDIVVVHNQEKRRGFWSLGKVEKLFPGRDGKIRAAAVVVYTGRKRPIVLHRPVQRLYPLEINDRTDATEDPGGGQETSQGSTAQQQITKESSSLSLEEPTKVSQPKRPKRLAAIEAQDRIIAQTLC